MNLANKITLARVIILPIIIIFTVLDFRLLSLFLLLLALLGDILDGFIARRFNCVTKKGALWDSYADFFMGAVTLFLFIFYNQNFFKEERIIIFIIISLMILPFILSYLRFNKTPEYHLTSNKINALIGYFFFFQASIFGYNQGILYLFNISMILNTLEKILLIRQGKMSANIKSIFSQ